MAIICPQIHKYADKGTHKVEQVMECFYVFAVIIVLDLLFKTWNGGKSSGCKTNTITLKSDDDTAAQTADMLLINEETGNEEHQNEDPPSDHDEVEPYDANEVADYGYDDCERNDESNNEERGDDEDWDEDCGPEDREDSFKGDDLEGYALL